MGYSFYKIEENNLQTFLPYSDFESALKCLDYKRLGKQRVEAKQIHNILTGQQKSKGWVNHPAVKMWESFEDALALYHNLCIQEWIKRGYKNNMLLLEVKNMVLPFWLGNEKLHASHCSNLLRKDFTYYSKFGWKEENNLSYFWPPKDLK
jgi:hypothetical protein